MWEQSPLWTQWELLLNKQTQAGINAPSSTTPQDPLYQLRQKYDSMILSKSHFVHHGTYFWVKKHRKVYSTSLSVLLFCLSLLIAALPPLPRISSHHPPQLKKTAAPANSCRQSICHVRHAHQQSIKAAIAVSGRGIVATKCPGWTIHGVGVSFLQRPHAFMQGPSRTGAQCNHMSCTGVTPILRVPILLTVKYRRTCTNRVCIPA